MIELDQLELTFSPRVHHEGEKQVDNEQTFHKSLAHVVPSTYVCLIVSIDSGDNAKSTLVASISSHF